MLVKGHCLVKKLKIGKCKKRIKRKQRWIAVHVCERDASRTLESGSPHFLSHHYQTIKRLINKQNKQNDKKIIDKEVEEEERLNSLSQKVSTQIIRTPLLDSSLSFIETLKLNSHTHSHLSLSLSLCRLLSFSFSMGDPMERLGTESDSSIKVDSDLSMEIDPPPPLRENVATAEDWRRALGRVVPAVVVLRTNACRAFDTESAGASYATGFVVDKRRGIVLTNRHVVKPGTAVSNSFDSCEEVEFPLCYIHFLSCVFGFVGPVVAEAMFVNREEVPVHPIYRDPVSHHSFFFCFFNTCSLSTILQNYQHFLMKI